MAGHFSEEKIFSEAFLIGFEMVAEERMNYFVEMNFGNHFAFEIVDHPVNLASAAGKTDFAFGSVVDIGIVDFG